MDETPVEAMSLFEKLKVLQHKVVDDLLERIRSGTASHQELAVAAKILKDNGIVFFPPDGPGDNAPSIEGFHTQPPAALPSFEDIVDDEGGGP